MGAYQGRTVAPEVQKSYLDRISDPNTPASKLGNTYRHRIDPEVFREWLEERGNPLALDEVTISGVGINAMALIALRRTDCPAFILREMLAMDNELIVLLASAKLKRRE